MTIHMNAIYENGLLRPLPFTEKQEVQLQIETGRLAEPHNRTSEEIERLLDELADIEPRDLSHLPEVFTREDFYEDRL